MEPPKEMQLFREYMQHEADLFSSLQQFIPINSMEDDVGTGWAMVPMDNALDGVALCIIIHLPSYYVYIVISAMVEV